MIFFYLTLQLSRYFLYFHIQHYFSVEICYLDMLTLANFHDTAQVHGKSVVPKTYLLAELGEQHKERMATMLGTLRFNC